MYDIYLYIYTHGDLECCKGNSVIFVGCMSLHVIFMNDSYKSIRQRWMFCWQRWTTEEFFNGCHWGKNQICYYQIYVYILYIYIHVFFVEPRVSMNVAMFDSLWVNISNIHGDCGSLWKGDCFRNNSCLYGSCDPISRTKILLGSQVLPLPLS